jgi:chemotaxis protein CheD
MLEGAGGKKAKRRILHPGEYHVTREPMLLSTLLGSCVSVCLYDPLRRVMGMNHFLLAERRHAGDAPILASEAGRYGIHAMELLINGLLELGAQRANLRAKAFGGGNVLGRACKDSDNYMCIGAVNTRFIKAFLKHDGIPLEAADLGGDFGRQIHFSGDDFSVYMRKIQGPETRRLAEDERLFLRRRVEQQANENTSIEYW